MENDKRGTKKASVAFADTLQTTRQITLIKYASRHGRFRNSLANLYFIQMFQLLVCLHKPETANVVSRCRWLVHGLYCAQMGTMT